MKRPRQVFLWRALVRVRVSSCAVCDVTHAAGRVTSLCVLRRHRGRGRCVCRGGGGRKPETCKFYLRQERNKMKAPLRISIRGYWLKVIRLDNSSGTFSSNYVFSGSIGPPLPPTMHLMFHGEATGIYFLARGAACAPFSIVSDLILPAAPGRVAPLVVRGGGGVAAGAVPGPTGWGAIPRRRGRARPAAGADSFVRHFCMHALPHFVRTPPRRHVSYFP